MEEIYRNVLLLINSLSKLSEISNEYKDGNGEKLINSVDECEEKFLKVKEEIVKMMEEVDDDEIIKEIEAIQTEKGFLIKER